MKNSKIKISAFAVLAIVAIAVTFTSCQKDAQIVESINNSTGTIEPVAMTTGGPNYGKKYWDGTIGHDCEGAGTKCVVIYPTGSDLYANAEVAISNGTLLDFVVSNNDDFQFSEEQITSINENESLLSSKFSMDDDIQIRIAD